MNGGMIVVDRIEGEYAVCEIDGAFSDVHLSQIENGVREGDLLIFNGDNNTYSIDKKATEQRIASIKSRFDRIKNKNKK